jgi:hypothetical protein
MPKEGGWNKIPLSPQNKPETTVSGFLFLQHPKENKLIREKSRQIVVMVSY